VSAGKRIASGLGVVLAVVGLAALVAPGLLAALPTDRALVLLLGVLLVLGGLRELQRRRTTDRQFAETPDTEAVVELPTPGDEFDERFARLSMTRYRMTERERLREEVEDVAEATLVRRRGLSPEEASESLRAGTWTDDPYAAAVFSGRAPSVGRVDRVREYFSSRPSFVRRTERAAAELAALVDDPQEPGPRHGVGTDAADTTRTGGDVDVDADAGVTTPNGDDGDGPVESGADTDPDLGPGFDVPADDEGDRDE
jgi:hypothetical protein